MRWNRCTTSFAIPKRKGIPAIITKQRSNRVLSYVRSTNHCQKRFYGHFHEMQVFRTSWIHWKPVRLCVINDQLEIYYSTELIAKHRLSDKKLNYKTSHYKQLLSGCIEDNATIDELAEGNLRQLDQLL